MASDGCEVDLGNDAGNCGACGARCSGVCRSGSCVFLGSGRDGSLAVPAGAPVVVNGYAELTASAAAGDTTLAVADAAPFEVGMLVMVWQTQADGSSLEDDRSAVDLAAFGVGHYELGRITRIDRAMRRLTLASGLVGNYGLGAQVVTVPEYTDVTVAPGATLTGAAWNGARGGIVAFVASGTVRVDGRVSVSGLGFRGGPRSNRFCYGGCMCTENAGPVFDPSCNTGRRGESVARGMFGGCGVGNYGNGGGGGGHINAGGAGGGNGGRGGWGGNAWCSNAPTGGHPGSSVTGTVRTHLTLGGGGGGGQYNNDRGPGGTDGGVGGGVIFVRARAIGGTGTWSADGVAARDSDYDGAGGGGAGGTISLFAVESIACGGVRAVGGSGGSNRGIGSGGTDGPGGGGGGGRVRIEAPSRGECMADVSGGAAGTGGMFPSGETGAGGAGVSE
jgi:hypothetical protein